MTTVLVFQIFLLYCVHLFVYVSVCGSVLLFTINLKFFKSPHLLTGSIDGWVETLGDRYWLVYIYEPGFRIRIKKGKARMY